ncbi:MAG: DUF2797 domain-containing protein [Bacteriovoracaceae bacterium]
MKVSGNILKMKGVHESPVQYFLPIGDEKLAMNPLIGKKISLKFDGVINCIETDEVIKKSYGQGYSYKSFISLAQCDVCIVKPELCHFDKGTCREPEWGKANCYIPHYIYLANTSKPKIGITRETQVPTRWIDQGAFEALPILKVPDRHTSGLIEVEFAKALSDKTNWRAMLKGEKEEVDLEELRESLFDEFADLLDSYDVEEVEDDVYTFDYPVESYPEKVTSLSFDKTPLIEGTLQGIRGQYLILDTGVLNIRKHQGYFIEIDY